MLTYEFILVISLGMTAWFKYKGKEPFPLFLFFMTMVVILEIPADNLYKEYYPSNYPLKNLFSKLCIYYYLYVFYVLYKGRSWGRSLRYSLIFYIAVTLGWQTIFQDNSSIDYLSYNIGFLLLIPLMLKYLYEVIYHRVHYNIFTDPYIYFIFGLFLFYTSSFPILGFINLLITDNPHYEIYYQLLNIGNIILSLAYLGAAICSKTKQLSIISY